MAADPMAVLVAGGQAAEQLPAAVWQAAAMDGAGIFTPPCFVSYGALKMEHTVARETDSAARG
jgi:hypothetical protein